MVVFLGHSLLGKQVLSSKRGVAVWLTARMPKHGFSSKDLVAPFRKSWAIRNQAVFVDTRGGSCGHLGISFGGECPCSYTKGQALVFFGMCRHP